MRTRALRARRPESSCGEALLVAAVLAALGAPAAAQLQFEELGKRHLPADFNATLAIATGDLDGDGDLDLVVGNNYGEPNRLYLNDGTGRYTDATAGRLPVGTEWTIAIALGDVDRDGDLDLVVGNDRGQPNRLYLNDGAGKFTDVTGLRMPVDRDSTNAMALGDVDGDGDLDLVLGNLGPYPGEQNRLYLNDGTGRFVDATAGRLPAAIDFTTSVALADVDGDGDLDLAVGNLGQQIRLYLNDGRGTFTDATVNRMPVALDYTYAVEFGDVDRDGDVDLVVGNSTQRNRLLLNNGTGTFTDATAGRLPADTDLARSVELGDVDGDGDLDLVVGNFNQQARLYLNNGTGTFTDATAGRMPANNDFTYAIAMGDVDGDTDLDLVVGNDVQQNRLYLNDGAGRFTDATAGRMPANNDFTYAIAMGDVDGDTDLDLVVGNDVRQNRLYLGDGRGSFTDATASRMPTRSNGVLALVLGDVDGDGDLDLLLGHSSSQISLFLNNGTGTFRDATAGRMPTVASWTNSLALGDVDGDGDLDLVAGNVGQDWLFLNNGAGTFVNATASRLPADNDFTNSVVLGDVDGDGDLDLVTGNGSINGPERNRLYLNNGAGTFTNPATSRLPSYKDATNSLALGDVDGDGDLDLVLGNHYFANSVNWLFLNDGTGTFADATQGRLKTSNAHTFSVVLGDVDGDGDLDIVFGNFDQPNWLFLNDGTGTFTDVSSSRMSTDRDKTYAVALGDVDGDGDLDLAVGNNIQPNRLYLNLLRQLDTPYLLRIGHPYRLDVYARHGPARLVDVALPLLATRSASIPLPPFGTLGLDPNALLQLPAFVIPPAAGVGSATVNVPNNPALAGIPVFGQTLLIQYPRQVRFTNVTFDPIRRL